MRDELVEQPERFAHVPGFRANEADLQRLRNASFTGFSPRQEINMACQDTERSWGWMDRVRIRAILRPPDQPLSFHALPDPWRVAGQAGNV